MISASPVTENSKIFLAGYNITDGCITIGTCKRSGGDRASHITECINFLLVRIENGAENDFKKESD
jgi:hypothetical protein